jgi:hypothetical protein
MPWQNRRDDQALVRKRPANLRGDFTRDRERFQMRVGLMSERTSRA